MGKSFRLIRALVGMFVRGDLSLENRKWDTDMVVWTQERSKSRFQWVSSGNWFS